MHLIYHPLPPPPRKKIKLHSHITVVPREIEENDSANFGGRGGKQGALWPM